MKPYISALADVTITPSTPDDEFVIGKSLAFVFRTQHWLFDLQSRPMDFGMFLLLKWPLMSFIR
jgi:hypothetical protein